MRPYKLKKHRSARAIVREWYKHFNGRYPPSESTAVDSHPLDGKVRAIPLKEMISSIKEQGCWAFVSIPTKGKRPSELHYWHDGKVCDHVLMEMFGHELGHLAGKNLKVLKREEERAHSYGAAAVEAFSIVEKIRGRKSCG